MMENVGNTKFNKVTPERERSQESIQGRLGTLQVFQLTAYELQTLSKMVSVRTLRIRASYGGLEAWQILVRYVLKVGANLFAHFMREG